MKVAACATRLLLMLMSHLFFLLHPKVHMSRTCHPEVAWHACQCVVPRPVRLVRRLLRRS